MCTVIMTNEFTFYITIRKSIKLCKYTRKNESKNKSIKTIKSRDQPTKEISKTVF